MEIWKHVFHACFRSGNRIDGSEIQGVYFELNATLEHSRAYRKNYSSQNTVIFPGTATNETLKKGLFCSEITLSESGILDDRGKDKLFSKSQSFMCFPLDI